ncbi:AAA family ATPase [Microbacterium aquimaris]|uniref:AAA family ATPase n=1 Tax=Microbacterium aquimaris TaxID=459816 RepID=A0ABU5N7C1_9MICO|nr:AAA family ATPase [Microbacterium aquimaris]MDZ8161994.1 AAA family ATPase [Microbacterium aquimaris]
MTWEPVELAWIVDEVAAGIDGRPRPTTLTRADGAALFYRGKVNGVHGDSGSGKTWVALLACAQEINAGRAATYIDYEGDPRSTIARLLDLGVTADGIVRRFIYTQPDTPLTDDAEPFLQMLTDNEVSLVVIDSVGEGMSIEDGDSNADRDVTPWFRKTPRRISDIGPAVVVLDHSGKRSVNELSPAGSHRKRAAISGAQYLIETLSPFSRERAGAAKLVCAKDRHGHYTVGQRVATLHVTPGDDLRVTLAGPDRAEEATDGGHRPTVLMGRVSDLLSSQGPLTGAGVESGVRGRRDAVRRALDLLVVEGNVTRTPGARGAVIHTLVTPFATSPQPRGEIISGDLDWPPAAGARSNATDPRNPAGESDLAHLARPRPTSPRATSP